MLFSKSFIRTKKEISSEIESLNANYLTRGGFVHQEMAGVYTFLPLGLKVINNISAIVRKHMDEISSEVLMPALQPKKNWEQSKRIDTIDVLMKTSGANEISKRKSSNEYILGCTHEDLITPLVKEYVSSYKDLPVYLYQIQSKYRNEARAKSGLMRGREFLMKDLYSFSATQEELMTYYEIVKKKYVDIFNEIGIGKKTYVTLASGGDFTSNFSHEFQFELEKGEDVIYIDETTNIAYNKEVVNAETEAKLGVKFDKMRVINASEVGNIFPLEVKFSDLFDLKYQTADNASKVVWMGSYGIGISRLMGVIAESSNDERGLIWPESIAPFKYHLVTIGGNDSEAWKKSEKFYNMHKGQVLWDDRSDKTFGEKLGDAELIGCPNIIIISGKSISNGGYELRDRKTGSSEIVSFE